MEGGSEGSGGREERGGGRECENGVEEGREWRGWREEGRNEVERGSGVNIVLYCTHIECTYMPNELCCWS